MKRRKKFYAMMVTVKTDTGRRTTTYSHYKKIRFRFNKAKKTLKATLTTHSGKRNILEEVNVEAVYVYED